MGGVVSASALKRDCGAIRKLSKSKPRTPNMVAAAEKGTLFHAAVELWARGNAVPEVNVPEVQGWLDLLASTGWWPRPSMLLEVAWGLRPDGTYTEVVEPEPHVYAAADGGPLLTAGRADVVEVVDSWYVEVGDWKSGRYPVPPPRYNLQALAGCLAMASRFGLRAYRPWIGYVRDGYFDGIEEDPIAVGSPEHEQALADVTAAALLDETARPGRWCEGCWERKRCDAGTAYILRGVEATP